MLYITSVIHTLLAFPILTMGNLLFFAFGWKDACWLTLVLLLIAEVAMPGSLSIAGAVLNLLSGTYPLPSFSLRSGRD